MFADVENLIYSSKNIKTLFKTINFELTKVFEWLKTNKLSIDTDKTNFILFHPRSATKNLPLLFLDGFKIEQVSSAKFLGVQINDNITLEQKITLMQKKISKNLGVLFKAKKVLNFQTLLKIYYSFIHICLIMQI